MDLNTLLKLANKWQNMGDAVQRQLQAILDGQDMDEQNPNALRMIAEFLNEAWEVDGADNLGTEIAEYLASDSDSDPRRDPNEIDREW